MSKSGRKAVPSDLSVGEMAKRAGVAVSTLHYYESEGLISSWRTAANHRRYDRRELRRVSVIRVAQTLGIPLAEVREVLSRVPKGAAVGKADWADASALWREEIDRRMALLERLRGQLDHCMGCGCLSLESCPLYNPGDTLARQGPGPRRWMDSGSENSDQ
ncbi:redox-sensitive transcriptional activator SoxR [Puniceibacterium sediminis]|uniref:MerR family transcriptional regulator, redox-sensitive transcriptional activator SoxR n=1 Tax=Puniceibacterium sediminis TaxID=1608407 RepID=A0A238V2M7_9RHOB|nr:redox-sensitive transcriptional activator SoxR [Puniceibacterium sediminis]SNR28526.1 MerR family transcriptional regulator, redox-sensitive transcriptional activator SoxR [Puniceibacterium sediminis]